MNDERNAVPKAGTGDWDSHEDGRERVDDYEDFLSDLGDMAATPNSEEPLPDSVSAARRDDELESYLDDFEQRRTRNAAAAFDADDASASVRDDDLDVLDLSEVVDPEELDDRREEASAADMRRHTEPDVDDGEPGMEEDMIAPALQQSDNAGYNRRASLGAFAIILAVAFAGAAGFMSYQTKEEVAALSSSLAEFTREGATSAVRSEDGRALDAVRQLAQRVEELAVIIEGPLSHVRETNQRELDNIALRIDTLENEMARMQQVLAEVREQMAPAAQPGKTEPVAPQANTAPEQEPAMPVAEADGGSWAINLSSYTREDVADAALTRLQKAGIKAVKLTTTTKGKTWYRVRVTGFASREEAEAYASEVESKTGLSGTWVVEQ